jgi:hypothetical protein
MGAARFGGIACMAQPLENMEHGQSVKEIKKTIDIQSENIYTPKINRNFD